jgi:hypothetical protein
VEDAPGESTNFLLMPNYPSKWDENEIMDDETTLAFSSPLSQSRESSLVVHIMLFKYSYYDVFSMRQAGGLRTLA